MPNIIIYTKDICPYCTKAKSLLQKKQVKFTEIKITNEQLKAEMIAKAKGKLTVPQIFINDQHIGGCDDLYALESANKLDQLLKN
jgi:glutaredoxin 3